MTKFSIIICTYNRGQYLIETLDSLIKLLDKYNSEILVIDNNSPDNTSTLVKSYLSIDSNIKYFLELNQGLSYARNRGIKEANGEILVFLDDDIDIDVNYFSVCEKLFKDNNFDIVGGKVLPYNVAIPDWLPLQYYYLASIFDLGDEMKVVNSLMGANYAMRKEVALKIGEYNVNLGRKGKLLLGGEENDYFQRGQKQGYEIVYCPELIVFHKIENKLNKDYIFDYAQRNGESSSMLEFQSSKIRFFLKVIKSLFILVTFNIFSKKAKTSSQKVLYIIKKLYAQGYLSGFKKILNK